MPQIGLTSRSAPKQNLYSRCRLHEIGRLEILSDVSDQRAVARMINGFHPGNDVYQPWIMMMDVFHEFGSSSDSAQHHKNDNDDQDGSKDTDAAVTIPVTIAAESATEATQ
jgi:hypothetical protein